MKLGFVSAILDNLTFEELIDYASGQAFECVETACWPKGAAERRYAGVTHIDMNALDDKKLEYIKEYCAAKNVGISSLAYYPNTLDPDPEKRAFHIGHIKKLIEASGRLGINMVTSFIGRIQDKNIEENLAVFKEVWTPVIAFAERHKVKVAIENCPMLFTNDQWPGGQNLAATPAIWREMFSLIQSKSFGLNYDPSHFVWQMMDYIKPIYEFKDRIFHVHCKDIKVYKDKLDDVGIMATPLQYMSPKIPGLGDVDWSRFISALTDIGYGGYICIEIEDKAFEHSVDGRKEALALSQRYLKQFII